MLNVSKGTFKDEVLNAETPVVVDFWASWCPPCKMMAPIFEEVSNEHEDVKFVKVDADENQALLAEYGIAGIPTFLMFKNGELAGHLVGAHPKEHFSKFVSDHK